MLCDYFEARDNDEAVKLVGQRMNRYVDGKGIEPTVCLGQLESLITGRPFADILADPESFVVVAADGEQGVIRLGVTLRQSLLALDTDSRPDVVQAWTETEELKGSDPISVRTFLRSLQDLNRHATAEGHGVYCLITA